jgi:hypothetical protein
MFLKLLKKLFFYIQVILISLYLILEEIVWDRFAQPIFRYIKYLKLFQKLEKLLNRANRYVILILFLLPFVIGELFGILSPIVAVQGYVILGVIFYALKLIIVAFAFWLFKVEQEKLLSFKIINYSYQKIVQFTSWIKTTQAFITIKKFIQKAKVWIKLKVANLKLFINRYFKRS